MGSVLCVVSNIMHLGEKLAMWAAGLGVLTCLVVTLILMLGLGIGLGYNYCFVEIKSKHKYVPGYYKYEVHNKPPTRPRTYATGYPYYRDPYYRDHYRDPYYRDQPHRAPYYRDQYPRDHYRDPYYRDQYHRYPYYRAKRFNDTITNGTRSNGTIINEAEYNGTKSNITQSINANNSLRLDEVNDIYEEGDEIGAEYNIEPEITEIKATEKVNFHSTSKSKNYEKVGHTKRVIKIDGLDLMTLLSKLKAENKSYSLHLETY